MPRKTPISDADKAACARFREARKYAKLSIAELARRIGLHDARLRNYEAQNNPFPFWVGVRIAVATDHCQRWLATGKLPKYPAIPVLDWVIDMVPRSLGFRAGYEMLSKEIDDRIETAKLMAKLFSDEFNPNVLSIETPIGSHPALARDHKFKNNLRILESAFGKFPAIHQEFLEGSIEGVLAMVKRHLPFFPKYRAAREAIDAEQIPKERAVFDERLARILAARKR